MSECAVCGAEIDVVDGEWVHVTVSSNTDDVESGTYSLCPEHGHEIRDALEGGR